MTLEIDKAINQWNWGAFLLGPVWCVGNRVHLGVIAWMPIIILFTTTALQLAEPQLFLLSEALEKVYFFGFPVSYISTLVILGFRGS
jgi:hypothetical protein